MRKTIAVFAVAGLAGFSGCGDDSTDPGDVTNAPAQAEPLEIDPADIPAQQLCANVAIAFPGVLTGPELSAAYLKLQAEGILDEAAALEGSDVSETVRQAATDLQARLADVENIDFDAPLMLGLVNDLLDACQPLGDFESTGLRLEEVP